MKLLKQSRLFINLLLLLPILAVPCTAQEQKSVTNNIQVTTASNVVLEIALEHLNNIKLPFATPLVDTSSPLIIKNRGASIVVGTNSLELISLVIRDSLNYDNFFTLTLLPKQIPSASYIVSYQETKEQAQQNLAQQTQTLSYSEELSFLLQAALKQELSPSFKVKTTTKFNCLDPSFIVRKQESWQVENYLIQASLLQNINQLAVKLDPALCYQQNSKFVLISHAHDFNFAAQASSTLWSIIDLGRK